MRRFAPVLGLLLLIPFFPAVPAPAEAAWWELPLLPWLPADLDTSTDVVQPMPAVSTPVIALGDDRIVPIPSNQDEFSIAANPLDPNNLVAGANDYCCSAVKAGFFTTFDGGDTWVHGIIPTPNRVCGGDPALAAGPDGTFWYIGITGFCGGADSPSTIFASKSTDGGLTWTTLYPIVSGGTTFEDKPYVAVDPRDGAVIITWTQFNGAFITFTRSADGGATWSPHVRLGTGQFSQPVVAPNGDIYVTWNGGGQARFARSTDNGATWQTFATGLSLGLPAGALNFRYNPTPTIVVAPGGPHAGRIYLAGPRIPGPTGGSLVVGTDIAVVTSDNRGATWSAVEAIVRPGIQLMPWMAAMPDGTIGIAYMDTVLSPQTWSVLGGPGGPGFVLLSQSLSTRKPGDAVWSTKLLTDLPSVDGSSTFWGDYQGLAATSLGFHPAFGDFRDSVCDCGANNGAPDFGTMRVLP